MRALVPVDAKVAAPSTSSKERNSEPQRTGFISQIPLLRDAALDSLAYLDDEAEITASRPAVEALVAEEAAAGVRTLASYRSMVPTPHPAVSSYPASVLAAGATGQPDLSRYHQVPESVPAGSSLEECGEILRRLDTIVVHDSTTLVNIGLQERFAPAVWKLSIGDLETSVIRAQKSLVEVKKQITSINAKRKLDQMGTGRRLAKLQREYRATVTKNAALRAELARLAAEKQRT